MQCHEAGLRCKRAQGLASLLVEFHSQPIVMYAAERKVGSLQGKVFLRPKNINDAFDSHIGKDKTTGARRSYQRNL
jgi:hypothetical protein